MRQTRHHYTMRIIWRRMRVARARGAFPYKRTAFIDHNYNYRFDHWSRYAYRIYTKQLNRLSKDKLPGPRELQGYPFGYMPHDSYYRRQCRRFLRRNGKEIVREALAEYGEMNDC